MDTSTFSNRPIDPDELPALEPSTFTPLAPGHRSALIAGRLVVGTVGLVAIVAAAIAFRLDGRLIGGLVGVWLIVVGLLLASVGLVHRSKGWQVRQHDISGRSGVVTRRVRTVPFSRVQNVTLRQTFLDRMFKIGRVEVFTAGAGADLHLDGIEPELGERLRLLVLERAGIDDDEGVEGGEVHVET